MELKGRVGCPGIEEAEMVWFFLAVALVMLWMSLGSPNVFVKGGAF